MKSKSVMKREAIQKGETMSQDTTGSLVEQVVGTKYIVQAWAGGQWYHSDSLETLVCAKREKARMEAISACPRRIIKQTWAIVKC